MKSLEKNLSADSLSIVISDAYNIAGQVPESNDSSYYVPRPTKDEWDEGINERRSYLMSARL